MNWITEKTMMEFINRFILGTSCYSCFSLQQSGFLQNTSKYSLKNPDFRRPPFIWLLAFEWKENFRLMLPRERVPSAPCYGFFLWVIPQQVPQGQAAHPGVCCSSINMARTYSSPDSKRGRQHSAPKASTRSSALERNLICPNIVWTQLLPTTMWPEGQGSYCLRKKSSHWGALGLWGSATY